MRAKARDGPQERQTIRVKSFEQGPSVQNVDTNAHILYIFGYILGDFVRSLDKENFYGKIKLLQKSRGVPSVVQLRCIIGAFLKSLSAEGVDILGNPRRRRRNGRRKSQNEEKTCDGRSFCRERVTLLNCLNSKVILRLSQTKYAKGLRDQGVGAFEPFGFLRRSRARGE